MEKLINKINEIIDDNSKLLVGILLRRLENLELPEEQSLTVSQIKLLYANLLKDCVYENSRILKKIIKINLDTGTIIFGDPSQKE